MNRVFTDEQKDAIQRQLVKIATRNNFEKRENLFKIENDLIPTNWTSVFKSEDVKKKEEIQRYLMLTSLPFLIYETDEDEVLRSMRTACEICLGAIWKIRTADHTAVLPTGSMNPEYFFVASDFIEEVPEHANLSYAHNIFVRKALISSGLHHQTWITHLSKLPGIKLQKELMSRYQFVEREISVLKPKMLIALGKRSFNMLSHLNIPNDIAMTFVTEPEYYQKHEHSYIEYGEALKNVITEHWRKISNEKGK